MDSTGDYILYVKPYNEQEGRSVLSLYDIGKRKSTTVIENVMLGEYFFSKDSRKVYFAVDADSDAAGDFVQKICCGLWFFGYYVGFPPTRYVLGVTPNFL